jgi:hypothetical protein
LFEILFRQGVLYAYGLIRQWRLCRGLLGPCSWRGQEKQDRKQWNAKPSRDVRRVGDTSIKLPGLRGLHGAVAQIKCRS